MAPHVASLPKSGIRKFFDIVAQTKGVISLGVGEPDFDTPWHISRAAVTCLENGGTHYTSNLGTAELRKSISAYIERRFGAAYSWENQILACVGVSEAIDLAIRALCSPGDEILYHEPCFVSYAATIRLAHAVPVPVETGAENDFKLTVEDLERKVSGKTKALLVNFPCNPTGATLNAGEMEAILEFAERHDLILLADEVYSELVYDCDAAKPLTSFASFPRHRERVVLLNGFSKSWAMTGYRLGYAAGPVDIIDAMMKIHQYAIMCAPTMAQAAALEALKRGGNEMAKMRESYRARRDFFVRKLNEAGLPCHLPNGAFYAFCEVSHTGLSEEEFAQRLLKEQHVAIVPGTAFGPGGAGFCRCSYATGMSELAEAAKRIKAFVSSLKN